MQGPEVEDKLIEVRLLRVVRRDRGATQGPYDQAIYLVEKDGKRGFPIVIGPTEADEIHRVVTGEITSRPLTHQLAYTMLEAAGAVLESVDVIDLRDNTFYAHVLLRGAGATGPVMIDARPSDAIALALRAGCKMRVAESVLEEARADDAGPDPLQGPEPGDEPDSGSPPPEGAGPGPF